MTDSRPSANKRLHYDPTVSLGNLLTAGMVAAGIVAYGVRLEAQLDAVEVRVEKIERSQDSTPERLARMEERLGSLQREIQRLVSRLDRRSEKYDGYGGQEQ